MTIGSVDLQLSVGPTVGTLTGPRSLRPARGAPRGPAKDPHVLRTASSCDAETSARVGRGAASPSTPAPAFFLTTASETKTKTHFVRRDREGPPRRLRPVPSNYRLVAFARFYDPVPGSNALFHRTNAPKRNDERRSFGGIAPVYIFTRRQNVYTHT